MRRFSRQSWAFPLLLSAIIAAAAPAAASSLCAVSISSPTSGAAVGQSGAVSGDAKVPQGDFLWLFAHPRGFDGWWPQGGVPAATSDGPWQVTAYYGSPQDVGAVFELVALTVDAKTNDALRDWNASANASGKFPPLRLPHSAPGCDAAKLSVKKTS